jgi:hypothetical protein
MSEPCGFTLEEQIAFHEDAITERKRALEKLQVQVSAIQVEINVSVLEIVHLGMRLDREQAQSERTT